MDNHFQFPEWKVSELSQKRKEELFGKVSVKFRKKKVQNRRLISIGSIFAVAALLIVFLGQPSLQQDVLAARSMLLEEIISSAGDVALAKNEMNITDEEGYYEKVWSYGDRCLSHCVH